MNKNNFKLGERVKVTSDRLIYSLMNQEVCLLGKTGSVFKMSDDSVYVDFSSPINECFSLKYDEIEKIKPVQTNCNYKCGICGREFINKCAHKCNGVYRKRHIKWINLNCDDKENKVKMISKEEFGKRINLIIEFREKQDKMADVILSLVDDGFGIFSFGDEMVNAYIEDTATLSGISKEAIEWFIYEAPRPESKLQDRTCKYTDGFSMNVLTPADLWEFEKHEVRKK